MNRTCLHTGKLKWLVRLPNGSGVSREVPAPFCERPKGKFLRSTHHTNSSFCQVELIFGTKVAKIVDAVTKISFNHLLSKEATFCKINTFNGFDCANNLNKKSITIKVVDRLHNMQTIQYIKSVEKQKNIAKETIQFYIPLARYVGLHAIAQELQDIAIKTLNV